ncbi:MAG TPA: hypothetical protein VIH75_23680 [Candidatus Sulfotelmatobacter sp.]|jgi:hypothetical protein
MLLPYLAIVLLAVVTLYSAVVSFRQKPDGEPAAPGWVFPDAPKRTARIFVGVATLLLAIGLGAWFKINGSSVSPNSIPRSWRFLIPEGYRGWVRVEFEIPGAPPLPAQAGQIVLKIPPTGLLRTSSSEQYGWAEDDYVFYASGGLQPIPDSGAGKLIWGKINNSEHSGSSGKRSYEEFFVGTQQQFKDQAEQSRPNDSPKESHVPAAVP